MNSKRKLDDSSISSDSDSNDNEADALTDLEGKTDRITVVLKARESRNYLSTSTNFSSLSLLLDHHTRPLWVCPNGSMYLETSNPNFKLCTDFLVAVAEPVSRPEFIHHYKLTPYSLYAAVSVNLDTETILSVLKQMSKTEVPEEVINFVEKCTTSFGKAKLVLKDNRLLVESSDPEVLKKLLKNKLISRARIGKQLDEFTVSEKRQEHNDAKVEASLQYDNTQHSIEESLERRLDEATADVADDSLGADLKIRFKVDNIKQYNTTNDVNGVKKQYNVKKEEGASYFKSETTSDGKIKFKKLKNIKKEKKENEQKKEKETVVNFEIDPEMIEQVKEQSIRMDFPLMEEYDFVNDKVNATLPMTLKAKLRPYQEKSLSKMFGNGRARSGLIVLPCGAGKTLTGIAACSTIKKSCIVFCSSGVAVEQWIREFKTFTNIEPEYIRKFTKDSKEDLHPSGATLLVTTYFIMSYSKNRNKRSQQVMNQIKNTEWGLILMDEVHVVPAKMFRKALVNVKSHCKLGLTATLVREDDLIDDLNFLIGPKLYEANWLKLTEDGYLAHVLCAEVWCPMTGEFFKEYLKETNSKRKQLLYVMNPEKYRICKLLLTYHEKKGDKILIFSDNIPALLKYARELGKYCMYGATTQREREILLRNFRGPEDKKKEINVLIISAVGDVAIDLPKCNIIIQISSHFGSRRQEAQRLGRILRPKTGARFNVGYNAFFYSLISMDTSEMYFSSKRQQYLVDQGYTFKVINDLESMTDGSQVERLTKKQEVELLSSLTERMAYKSEELNLTSDDVAWRKLRNKNKQPKNRLMKKLKNVHY